jgi:hypothetical protein
VLVSSGMQHLEMSKPGLGRHGWATLATEEVPLIAAGIAAPPKTSRECQKRPKPNEDDQHKRAFRGTHLHVNRGLGARAPFKMLTVYGPLLLRSSW